MAEFINVDLENPKPSFPEMNSDSIKFVSNLSEMEGFNTNFHRNIPLFSNHQPQPTPMTFNEEFSRTIHPLVDVPVYDPALVLNFFPSDEGLSHGCNNMINVGPESDILLKYSPSVSGTGSNGANKSSKNHNYGGKKRKRIIETDSQKPREVVHVRAKRGQATDSHSLAERLRREKINERLRCLQDLVPGCYKTMGMAVMLEVIINYVRSLQNQIDFLSMKLSAASLFYDFNSSEAEAIETMQGTTGYEAQGMEKLAGEGYGGPPQSQVSWPFLS